jgi:hypothetical protein
VDIAEERCLPAAEAVVGDGHRDGHVDADHAGLDLELELPSRAPVAREDGGAVAVRVVVDEADRLLVGLDPHHGQDGTEDLVLGHISGVTRSMSEAPRKKPPSVGSRAGAASSATTVAP